LFIVTLLAFVANSTVTKLPADIPQTNTAQVPVFLAGDINNDGIVNSLDWSIMRTKWFSADLVSDINKDGLVNSIDFSILNNNWMKVPPVTPPVVVVPPVVPPVVVAPPPVATPPTPGSVAVQLHRYSGPAGQVQFSNGFPLQQGKLTASQLGNVTLFLNGIEQSIFVKALGGKWSDGSLRSILIQGLVTGPASGQATQGFVGFNTARSTGLVTEVATPSTLSAAVLATSQTYLVSTEAGGKMLTASQVAAGTSNMRAQDVDFETMAPQLDLQYLNQWARDQSLYDHTMSTYQHFMQTGDPKWYKMAWGMGNAYQTYFLNGGVTTEWANNTESLVVHYWMTGNESTRGLVGKMTEWWTGAIQFYDYDMRDGYMRVKGRAMLAQLDCLKIACNPGVDKYRNPFTTPYNLRTILPSEFTKLLTLMDPNGLFPGGTQYNGGQKNFMVGIFLTAVTRYYDEFSPEPQIPPFVKKSLDYMMANEWDAPSQGFRYCTKVAGDCNITPQPGLNNLILPAYVWYYANTRDATYLGYADQLFAGNRTTRQFWLPYVKQFDQSMYRVVNYYFLRQ